MRRPTSATSRMNAGTCARALAASRRSRGWRWSCKTSPSLVPRNPRSAAPAPSHSDTRTGSRTPNSQSQCPGHFGEQCSKARGQSSMIRNPRGASFRPPLRGNPVKGAKGPPIRRSKLLHGNDRIGEVDGVRERTPSRRSPHPTSDDIGIREHMFGCHPLGGPLSIEHACRAGGQ